MELDYSGIIHDYGSSIAKYLYLKEVAKKSFPSIYHCNWPTERENFGKFLEENDFDYFVRVTGEDEFVFSNKNYVGWGEYNYFSEKVDFEIASTKISVCEAVIAKITRTLHRKKIDETGPPQINVDFWFNTVNGPRSTQRTLTVPKWESIIENYPQETRASIQGLIDQQSAAEGGKLILWHGPPGTGKTFAIRALGYAWKDWCTIHYITDPEEFFGEPSYLISVMLNSEDFTISNSKWKLILLEDTGELLSADAKTRTGQGLSRFLNVVDGMLGQGMNVTFMVTTNEELKSLHPAVARPGRTSNLTKFEKFDSASGQKWLVAHGIEDEVGHMTLAELYSRLDGKKRSRRADLRPVGFARS